KKKAGEKAGSAVSPLVIRYRVDCQGKAAGYVYTDSHRVRTHPETLMIALGSASEVKRVEVISFDEPQHSKPKDEWYGKFEGQKLGAELALKRAIPVYTGASITSRVTTEATRRALAIHEVLESK